MVLGGVSVPETILADTRQNNPIIALLEGADALQEEKNKRAARASSDKPMSVRTKKPTMKELKLQKIAMSTALPDNWHTVWSEDQLEAFGLWLTEQPAFALDTETVGVNPFTHRIVGISFYMPDRGYYIPLHHNDHIRDIPIDGDNGTDYVHCLPLALVSETLKPLLEDRNKKIFTHNGKFDQHVMAKWMDIHFQSYFDTMIGQSLLDETQSKKLKDLATTYLKLPTDRFSTLFGTITFEKVPIRINPDTRTGNLASYYAIKDAFLTWELAMFQGRAFNRPGLESLKRLMFEVEMPFLQIVTQAERRGIQFDSDYMLNKVAALLRNEIEELRQKIWAYTGEINLNAPAQVAEVLYEKLKLPRVNEIKPNSTDKITMNKLKPYHDVVKHILSYKQKAKLMAAFVDKLPRAVVAGRVHTSFNSVGTRTGRMSASNPNMQQVPSRIGNLIRNAFVSDTYRLLASIDFSQQEIRWLAHVTNDSLLLDTFRRGLDVHSQTAVGMWNASSQDNLTYEAFEYRRGLLKIFVDKDGNITEAKMSPAYLIALCLEGIVKHSDPDETRREIELGAKYDKTRTLAKTINFGIIYGMSKYKLAEILEINIEDAETYIEGYFARYPGVRNWMAEQRAQMDKRMYTVAFGGRKRRVHEEMMSDKRWIRQRGYRMGINHVIQGSSAMQVKIASIQLQKLFEKWAKEGVIVAIVLWVHDEIIFDVPEGIGMHRLKQIADIMCNAVQLECGMKSDIEIGVKWGQKMTEEDIRLLFEEEEEEFGGMDEAL